MVLLRSAFGALALAASSQGSSLASRGPSIYSDSSITSNYLQPRAAPNAPNGYTPEEVDCPSNRPIIRSASSLSDNERSWLDIRRNATVDSMRELLQRINIPDFDAPAYISDNANNQSALPNIGIAASGGGYRALLNGAGAIAAFDARENNATSAGHLGGLLQAATYLGGLSGGGWLVTTLFINNFTTVSALLNDPSKTVWDFDQSIFEGPDQGSIQLLDTADYFQTIEDQVSDKADAGFNRSVTDYWGRALSFQLINATDGGPGYTWSSIASSDDFKSGNTPFPMLVADGRAPGEMLISGNTTVYEINPFELGTWDPTTFGFAPLEFLGSNFSNGVLAPSEKCVRGFDNAGYIMGTSSSLFNQFLLQVNATSLPKFAKSFISDILTSIGQDNNDIADYSPNPFYGYHNSTSRNAQSSRLTLVDGGEDLQNIPLHPMIQPNRHVDVMFAIDSSADTDSVWPNGTALVATYERNLNSSGIGNGTSFPSVPDTNSFVNLGLNTHPTFFGCNSSNTSSITPLIVYIPNSPYVFHSNISTFTPSYSTETRNAIVQNGYEVATMGNATADPQWPVCVGCAILSRSLERTGTDVPDACTQCFQKYCWDGTTNSTKPSSYEPSFKGQAVSEAPKGHGDNFLVAAAAAAISPYLHLHCGLGEAPYYEELTHSLRFVDIVKEKLHVVDVEEGPSSHEVYDLDTAISTTAHIQGTDDELIVGAKLGYAIFNRGTKKVEYIKKVWNEHDGAGEEERMRCNDGAVDKAGRYWVGTMNDPKVKAPTSEGVLFRLDPDLTLHRMIENVTIPNGIGWSLDDTKMFFIDSPTRNIFVFDFDASSGSISNRQVFFHYADEEEGVPDGFAMDTLGNLWTAICGGGKVLKISPEGRVVGEISLPTRMISCPGFAGEDLFITSAEEEDPVEHPESVQYGGSLFKVHVGVSGMALHRFKRI
ncbi:MAG: hypothetical protein Q9219_004051 [cf. Caloplaca sp. 3 TL-2023]